MGKHVHKLSAAGLLVTLGIIYGDIGTSPLYVMKAIIGDMPIRRDFILGGISCVFWTLTLQTTVKYVMLTLRADNNGEGGIFSLYALVRRRAKYLIAFAMIGGATLLADGIITPPISVASAIEGLRILDPNINTIPIILSIIILIFVIQRFGTSIVGKGFGPIMFIWFSMLAILGLMQIVKDWTILYAFSPHYAFRLLVQNPGGFWVLGAVFLCTTGAEALYSDLGHCGRENIRISWAYVKVCLILNYFGQGAYLIHHKGEMLNGQNPFFLIMPQGFLIFGIIIATAAAIIASQALISGSFTLISEAMRLNLFPRVTIKYPSNIKGQLYIPLINWFLCIGCIGIVLYFRESGAMEAAYGLAITLTMLMTTLLLSAYLTLKRTPNWIVIAFLSIYFLIEGAFLIANLEKFPHGGYVTLIISLFILFIMYTRYRSTQIKNRLREYVKIADYIDQLTSLSHDDSLPKYATNLVFLSTAPKDTEVESKIMYSILQKLPKRADIYWFVHIEVTEEPYTMEYKVNCIAKDDIYRVRFRLGFRVEERISVFLRFVIEEMVKNNEVNITSRYHSLKENNIAGDFRFVILEEILSHENDLSFMENIVLSANFILKGITATPEKWFKLDTNLLTVEKVPLIIKPLHAIHLNRIVD
ncbi:MAG: KUP/HAK/KT family potassium transporter [Chitinophagales bacterium]|nr:KUP/HAK/KT family potassium transporter [Chitinophagales bacterium]